MPCQIYRGEVEAPLPEGLNLGGNAVTAEIGIRMAALGGSVTDLGGAGSMSRSATLCGPDFSACLDAARSVWDETQSAAEEAQDHSSACRFTWSCMPNAVSKMFFAWCR